MSEELINNIKEKINNNEISMKPHYYFVLGSIAIFLGMLGSISLSTFFTTALFFRARVYQGFGCDLAYNSTPWVLILLTLGFFTLAIYLFEKYDISYKVSVLLITILIALTVIFSGYTIDKRDMHKGLRRMPMMNRIFNENDQNRRFRISDIDTEENDFENGNLMMGKRLRDGSGAGLGNKESRIQLLDIEHCGRN